MESENSHRASQVLSQDRVINQQLLKDELKCRICLGVVRIPYKCKICEFCFCAECLEEWFKNSYNCPLKCSEQPKFKNRPHKLVRNMLSELILSCKNAQSGCSKEVPYDKLEEHETHCKYELMTCKGKEEGCTQVLVKGEMESHERSCPYVPIECLHCQKNVRRSGIKAHLMHCEEAEVKCEYCNADIKKKNYLIHLNAQCEDYIMNCGRCSSTYKRKFKNFHDCVRHLQNQQKTMGEEIQQLKEKLLEKDRKLSELEAKVFFEISDLKLLIQKLQDENHIVNSKLSSISKSTTQIVEQQLIPQSIFMKWDQTQVKHFSLNPCSQQAKFRNEQAQSIYQPHEQVLGYLLSETELGSSLEPHSRCTIELQVQQNMTTSFTPMYYIIGALTLQDFEVFKTVQHDLQTFEHVYSQLSPNCWFIPSFSKTFQDKLRFSVRKVTQRKDSSGAQIDESQTMIEIEAIEKRQKQKLAVHGDQLHVFFGFYCSQSSCLADLKSLQVKID